MHGTWKEQGRKERRKEGRKTGTVDRPMEITRLHGTKRVEGRREGTRNEGFMVSFLPFTLIPSFFV